MASRRATITRTFLLPGLVPRFWNLFGSGFSHLALYMAHAYRTVRLLPQGHPYLRSENIGKFGIWHVIRAARQNLIFDREHLDQVIIYYVMFVGLFLLFFQIFLLLVSLSIKGASAAALGAYWKEFFHTPNPSTDIAFQFLDRVFCLFFRCSFLGCGALLGDLFHFLGHLFCFGACRSLFNSSFLCGTFFFTGFFSLP